MARKVTVQPGLLTMLMVVAAWRTVQQQRWQRWG